MKQNQARRNSTEERIENRRPDVGGNASQVAALLHTREIGLVVPAQAEFSRDNFLGKVTFADEQGKDEGTRSEHATQDAANGRLEFPKAFEHLREKVATAQFIRVLIGRRSRIGIQRRAMADQNERSVGEAVI